MTHRLIAIAIAASLAWAHPVKAEEPVRLQPTPVAAAVETGAPGRAVTPPPAAAPAAPAAPAAEPPPPTPAPAMRVVTLDASELAKPRPVPPLSALDKPASDVVRLTVNKTRPVDLPGAVSEVVIGNPEIADVLVRAPNQVFLMAKSLGDTNLFFLDRNGKLISRMEVHVHADVEAVKAALAQYLPEETIDVGAVGNSVTLSGTVRSDAAAATAVQLARRLLPGDENVINLMRIAGEHQVLLRVKLVEMNRTIVKELGVDWTHNDVIGALSGDDLDIDATFDSGGLSVSSAYLPYSLAVNLDTNESDVFSQVLAEPVLTSLSGEEARVMAGREFPIAVTTIQDGVAITAIEWRDIGVSLIFTPVIVGPGRINVKASISVTAIEEETVAGYPVLSSRRASAAVEMPSGGSMMIAGVLRNNMTNSLSGVPGMMDLPILGALFRSDSFTREETELVVIVQALVVQPTDPQKLATPSDGFRPASDLDRYLLGRIHKVYNKGDVPATESPRGPIGYIVQ